MLIWTTLRDTAWKTKTNCKKQNQGDPHATGCHGYCAGLPADEKLGEEQAVPVCLSVCDKCADSEACVPEAPKRGAQEPRSGWEWRRWLGKGSGILLQAGVGAKFSRSRPYPSCLPSFVTEKLKSSKRKKKT